MQLTVLGASATYPSPESPASGYLVATDKTIWIDAGSGTFAALQRRVPLDQIDAVFLSHRHPDHCSDIFGLLYALRHGVVHRSPIPIYAPRSVRNALERFLDRGEHPFADIAVFIDVEPSDTIELGATHLSFAEAAHPVPTLAIGVEHEGRSLVYTADTGVSEPVTRLAAGADLLLAEATYQGAAGDKPWPHHLTAAEAGTLARRADVERLVLTHIWPELDPERSLWEAGAEFDGAIGVAVADETHVI